ncbi:MAG: winged helix-turn-helix transcriptional regulator [Bifidobacterium pseudocatenulatum]
MLGSVRDCRQSLFGPSADRVHDHGEYSLTEVGESLRPIIDAMKTWGTITETNTSSDCSSHWSCREPLSSTAAWETKGRNLRLRPFTMVRAGS